MRRGGQQLVTMESSDEDSGDPQEVWIVKSFHSFICELLLWNIAFLLAPRMLSRESIVSIVYKHAII